MIDKLKVLEGGRIIIPENIINKLGISTGDEITIFRKNDEFLLELDDSFQDVSKYTEYLLKELWDNKDDEEWSQELIKMNKILFKEI